MNAQDVALWIGIASSIGGAAVGYGTLTEKVSTLEANTDATHLESRLTKLEVRIEDNDIGRIGKEIETVRGEVARVSDRLEAIDIPNTDQIKEDVKVLQTEINHLKQEIQSVNSRVERLASKGSNPLL
jgi:chromosome segregation ATPase